MICVAHWGLGLWNLSLGPSCLSHGGSDRRMGIQATPLPACRLCGFLLGNFRYFILRFLASACHDFAMSVPLAIGPLTLIEGRGHPAKCRVWERGQKSLGDLAKGMYSLLGNR